MDPASVDAVAARARTENFPVASLLFPRAVRPHLRAIYGFARLVDMLGDEVEGDRLAALDELEREVDACYESEPTWAVMQVLQPTIRACSLPREPFQRLIEANRMDQRISDYESWDDLKHYCVHSADPVGRLVLGVLGRAEPELVALSDDVCTGLQLVNFLQDVPRDLALGRIYLPARGPAALRRRGAGQTEPGAARAARVRGRAGARAARFGRGARPAAGRPHWARGRRLRARRTRGAPGARARGLGHLQRPPAALAGTAGLGGDPMSVGSTELTKERRRRLCRCRERE